MVNICTIFKQLSVPQKYTLTNSNHSCAQITIFFIFFLFLNIYLFFIA